MGGEGRPLDNMATPVRRQSSFQLFKAEHVPAFLEKNPHVKRSDFSLLSKEMSKLWNALDPTEKDQYKKLAAAQTTQNRCAMLMSEQNSARADRSRSPPLASRSIGPSPRSSQTRSRNHHPPAPGQASTSEPPSRRGKRGRPEARNHTQDQESEPFCMKCKSVECSNEFPIMLCGPKGHGCPNGMHPQCLVPPLQQAPRGTWWCPTCEATRQTEKKKRPRVVKTNGGQANSGHCEGHGRASFAPTVPLTQAGAAQRSSAQSSNADGPRLNVQE